MRVADTIYLDYQAATPMDPRVIAAVTAAMHEDFANPSSEDHALGWRARAKVEVARTSIADAWGAEADDIIFTSGATEANNLGVLGAALNAPAYRRRILVSAIEHKAVLEAAYAARALGFVVELIPVTTDGVIDLDALVRLIDHDVAVISVMAVNNEIGVIQPIAAVAAMATKVGAFFHCDATQAPAAMAVDLVDLGVDAASFSSHKIYGPKGVGALYLAVTRPWSPRPLVFGGGQEVGLRPGTVPTPLLLGFAEAVRILTLEGSGERLRIAALRSEFLTLLADRSVRPTVTAEGSLRHPGTAHLAFEGVDASELLLRLQPKIAASTGSACTSGVIGPSHVLRAIGMSVDQANHCIRFSLGRFTDRDQLSAAASAIAEALEALSVDEIPSKRISSSL